MEEQSFFKNVRAVIARIPRGKVATYGQVAMMAGRPRAARIVAWAMRAKAAEELPCHRVVNRLGTLAPSEVFGSKEFQRAALENEGVLFLPDGRIDMKACLWNPEENARGEL